MPARVIAYATRTTQQGSTPYVLPAAVRAGDVLVCFNRVYSSINYTVNPPAGWTNFGHFSWYRVCDGTEGDSFVFEWTASGAGVLLQVRGADPDNPVEWAGGGGGFEPDGASGNQIEITSNVTESFYAIAAVGSTGLGTWSFPEPWELLENLAHDGSPSNNCLGVAIVREIPRGSQSWLVTNSTSGGTPVTDDIIAFRHGPLGDRVRGSTQEDTGSIFDSVEVKAVDSSVREDFFLDVDLDDGDLVTMREALRPDTDAFAYYPLGQQTTEKLNAYSGETILSRMSRVYPPPIMQRVADIADLSGELVDGVKVSAQAALQYIFDTWFRHDTIGQWFQAEPVPDLRVRRSDNDYTGTNGVLYTETISIPQIEDRRLSMLDIVREWMSAFPGTVARPNSWGSLEIVPIVGPDADTTPAVTLGLEDCLTISEGKPDPSGVVNRWTVANRPITKQSDFPIMQPAWFQMMSNYHMNEFGERIEPPTDRLDISGHDTFEGTRFSDNRPGFWPVSEEVLPGGEAVKLTDSLGNKQITVSWTDEDGSTGTINPSEITVRDIPFTGEWVEAISIWREACSTLDSLKVNLKARWVADGRRTGVEFALGSPMQLETCTWLDATARRWVLGFTLSDASDGYAEDEAERKATFGIVENDDFVPAIGGGNAIESSQDTYGIVERQQVIRVFEVPPEQLMDIAIAGVLANIDPKVVREVKQSTWRAFAITQEHVGRLVQLPNGEQGIVVSRSYVDDFSSGEVIAIDSTVKVRITSEIVDSSTEYLFLNDSSYFLMNDGNPSQAN